jgi:hypothetical protein
VLLIAFLGYLVMNSIKEPIAFKDAKDYRTVVVSSKLEKIRTAQEIYRAVTGSFAGDFDQLVSTLRTDSIPFEKITPDPNEPDNEDLWERSVSYSAAIDTIDALGINLDSLSYIPFTYGMKFNMEADTIEYQSTKVNVVQVGTKWKDFMGKYGDIKYSKYDKSYNPEMSFKFGDMSSPSLSGNWE